MKTKLLVAITLGSLLAVSAPMTFAAKAQTQPGQMVKALEALKDKNYIIIKKIKFDNDKGVFIAKVVNAEGKNLEIHINPTTGDMGKPEGEITGWTAIEIAKKVQDAGINNIYEINTEIFGNKYDVKALDDQGKKVTVKVDVKSGEITK
jgi:uncharacterized membrane protein YkoI